MGRRRRKHRMLELIFTPQGGAELVDPDTDEIEWASDEDDDFRDNFADEFLGEKDCERVIDWLIDNDVVTEQEADALDVFEESLDGESLDEEESEAPETRAH